MYVWDCDKDEKNDWFVVGGCFGLLCESVEKFFKEENKLICFFYWLENRILRDWFEVKRLEFNFGNVKIIVGICGIEKKYFNLIFIVLDGKVYYGVYVCGVNKLIECIKYIFWKDDFFIDRCNFVYSWKGDIF